MGGRPQPEPERAQAVLGWICAVVCVSMYAAPLDVALKVIRRRVAVEDCMPCKHRRRPYIFRH